MEPGVPGEGMDLTAKRSYEEVDVLTGNGKPRGCSTAQRAA